MVLTQDIKTALIAAAACSWVALIGLSLTPSRLQISGNLRCAVAFFVVAAITRLAFREFETRWQLTGFAIAAAAFWFYQVSTMRRDVPSTQWLASASGAFLGAIVMRIIAHHHLWRHL